jgi:hypothetical protein
LHACASCKCPGSSSESAQRRCDAIAESFVGDCLDSAPGGVGDLFGLELGDVGVRGKDEAEVDALGPRSPRRAWPAPDPAPGTVRPRSPPRAVDAETPRPRAERPDAWSPPGSPQRACEVEHAHAGQRHGGQGAESSTCLDNTATPPAVTARTSDSTDTATCGGWV